RTSFSRSSAMIVTDVSRFQAVLLNLVLNARDAMAKKGSISIEVRRLAADGQDWVEISVSDDGVGMDKETLSRAFDPFFTTKAPGRGNGLGLSQVRTFVEYNKGEFEIDSAPNKGTTIWLRLPAAS
ncbi:MAG: ATP-binding protein, partial [Burkholderiales bacterium]|nr:ATP-binding protein [Burkholderiales bacterium]